jgi:Immunity protein 10
MIAKEPMPADNERTQPGLIIRRAAYARLDSDVETVTMAEEPDGDGFWLSLQASLSPYDEQDRRLGMDTYCLTTSDGSTAYGGIAGFAFGDGWMDLELDAEAADDLGLPRSLRIALEIPQADIDSVRIGFAAIMARTARRGDGSGA